MEMIMRRDLVIELDRWSLVEAITGLPVVDFLSSSVIGFLHLVLRESLLQPCRYTNDIVYRRI